MSISLVIKPLIHIKLYLYCIGIIIYTCHLYIVYAEQVESMFEIPIFSWKENKYWHPILNCHSCPIFLGVSCSCQVYTDSLTECTHLSINIFWTVCCLYAPAPKRSPILLALTSALSPLYRLSFARTPTQKKTRTFETSKFAVRPGPQATPRVQ